jgi:hypothetical protein
MESSLQTTSLSTRNRQRKQSDCWPWNRHWSMSDADVWSRQRQRIHERRIKPIAKIDSNLTHGFVKHTMSHCRTRNHLWKLSQGWRMESTAHTNSLLTYEINRENRVIVDAWNRHCKLRPYRPEIVSENRVTIDLEIANEIWVKTDVWSR